MFQRILVPIDGSPTSAAGLREAIALAKDQDAKLYLIHVVDELLVTHGLDGTSYVAPNYVEDIFAALREQGRRLLDKASAAAKRQSVKCQTILVETVGRGVADVIAESAKKHRADLIVIGTHGRRGITRLVMGSDAEGVVRAARVPVMLVRHAGARRAGRSKTK